ncbi:hypothetical protein JT358_04495 [Micrococcales bacterium 31B]|nr:hypothetical protein [Micrococcales bacterium 31B]
MTANRLRSATVHSFLDLLSRDLSTASLPCTLGLYHRPTQAWVYGAGDGAPDDFEGDYVLALPGRM